MLTILRIAGRIMDGWLFHEGLSFTSPYNSEYSAEFTFGNGLIRMVDTELIYDSDGNISERKYHCEYFRYTGEKIEFNTEN